MPDPPPSIVVMTVPGRVDRVEADDARVERLRAAGALAAVVRPADRRRWWADDDAVPVAVNGSEEPLTWASRFPFTRRRRRLAEALREASCPPKVAVHAAGCAAWAEALAIGELLDAGVLLGAREEAAVRAARRLLKVLNPTRCIVVAETEPLAERLRSATDNLLVVEVVPPCVPERDNACRRRDPGHPLLIAVPLDRSAEGFATLLGGLAAALEDRPRAEVQLLVLGEPDALAAGHALAGAAGLLSCVSAAPGASGAGDGVPLAEVLRGVDAVARPWVAPVEEPPVGLEAAARGLPVLAPRGGAPNPPAVAREVIRPEASAWCEVFCWMLDGPEDATAAGAAARDRVRRDCRVGASDAALLHLAALVIGR